MQTLNDCVNLPVLFMMVCDLKQILVLSVSSIREFEWRYLRIILDKIEQHFQTYEIIIDRYFVCYILSVAD